MITILLSYIRLVLFNIEIFEGEQRYFRIIDNILFYETRIWLLSACSLLRLSLSMSSIHSTVHRFTSSNLPFKAPVTLFIPFLLHISYLCNCHTSRIFVSRMQIYVMLNVDDSRN